MRAALALSLALATVMPAAAQTTLPSGMQGTWARETADCMDQNSDGRVVLDGDDVLFFASTWTVRRWQRSGDLWRATARVESEGERSRGRIALRLMSDGRLEVRTEADEPLVLTKCVESVPLR